MSEEAVVTVTNNLPYLSKGKKKKKKEEFCTHLLHHTHFLSFILIRDVFLCSITYVLKFLGYIHPHTNQMTKTVDGEYHPIFGGEDFSNEPSEVRESPSCIRWITSLFPVGGYLGTIFSVAATVIGAGLLSLPSSFKDVGMFMAVLYLVLVSLETIYTMRLLAILAERTGIYSLEGLSELYLNAAAGIMLGIIRIIFCFGACVAYVISVGNLMQTIIENSSNAPEFLRTNWGEKMLQTLFWLLFMLSVVIPRQINTLRYISAAGVGFIVLFVVVIVIHACMNGLQEHPRPEVQIVGTGNNALNGVGVFIFSFLNQFNCLEVYQEMNPRTKSVRNYTICSVIMRQPHIPICVSRMLQYVLWNILNCDELIVCTIHIHCYYFATREKSTRLHDHAQLRAVGLHSISNGKTKNDNNNENMAHTIAGAPLQLHREHVIHSVNLYACIKTFECFQGCNTSNMSTTSTSDHREISGEEQPLPASELELPALPSDNEKRESIGEMINEDEDEMTHQEPASVCSTVCALLGNLIPAGSALSCGFNLASTSVGAGIVGMPAGFSYVGLVMAILYLIGVTAETAYSIGLLVDVSEKTGLKNFEELAKYLLHPKANVAVAIIRVLNTLGGTVAFVVTIRDLISPIITSMHNVPSFWTSAVGLRLMQTILFMIFMFPLTIPRFINAFRYVSAVGISFIVYLSIIIITEACTDGLQKDPRPEMSLFKTGNGALNGMGFPLIDNYNHSFIEKINCQAFDSQ
eukprot:gene3665-2595_t